MKKHLHFHHKQQYKEKYIMTLVCNGRTFAEASKQWSNIFRLTMAELDVLCFPSRVKTEA